MLGCGTGGAGTSPASGMKISIRFSLPFGRFLHCTIGSALSMQNCALMAANQLDLSTRRAIVTGGASGIGLESARRLLASRCAAVMLWDRDAGALERAAASLGDSRVRTATVDVT